MGFFNSIKNVDELLAKVGYLRQYLRVYDEKDIILFRYKSKGDAKMLSNMWASSVPLPWRGKEYNSVEQMIISSYIEDNCNPKYHDEMIKVLDLIHKCKDGLEVKNNKEIQKLYTTVREETIAAIGEEKWDLNDWAISSAAIKVKYDYCPEFRKYVDANKDKINAEPIYVEGVKDTNIVEVAMEYTDSYTENIFSYVNNINTEEGGTHLSGFKQALTRSINDYARKNNLLKESDDNLSGDDCREGITAVISIKVQEPQFEGQTKTKLGNSEIRGIVDNLVTEQLEEFFEEHPSEARKIIEKAVMASRARAAARKARDLTRRKSILESSSLPGKLADCQSKDNTMTEIYLVEGDSAGGSAKQGRDRKFQAILPLRGKILNVEKARLDRMLSSDEIKNMITAFGCGIGEDFDISKARYGKIIIMTDADVDGAHIATLLLTFFYRYMKPLITEGHVYIAKPPLYLVKKGQKAHRYAYTDEELRMCMDEIGSDKKNVSVQRYKGLGEMNPEQLWETTMDPQYRTLLQVTLSDAAEADAIFSILMGDKVEPRRQFIEENATKAVLDL